LQLNVPSSESPRFTFYVQAAFFSSLSKPMACRERLKPKLLDEAGGVSMARVLSRRVGLFYLTLAILGTARPHAQALRTLTASAHEQPVTALTVCGVAVPPPRALPSPTSGPVVYLIAPCFERQGGRPRLQPETYLREIHLKPSRPSQGQWTPYDSAAERIILEDFQRLWTNFALADLSIEIRDFQFSNGVIGKVVTYDITERD
jgi:hypothetical protein